MQGSDFYSGSALGGAAGGAATGATIGSSAGPYGTVIGGLVGGGIGLFGGASANSARDKAVAGQSKNIDALMRQMSAKSAENYRNYLEGLKKAQAFYGPAMESWNHFYGPGTATGNFDVPRGTSEAK